MASVLTMTRLGAVLDNRPAVATGAAGTLLFALAAAALLHAAPDRGPIRNFAEVPFAPGMVIALGSPDELLVALEPTATPTETPDEPDDQVEPEPDPEPTDVVDHDAVTDEPSPPKPRPPKPRPPKPSPDPGLHERLPPVPGTPTPGTVSRGDPFGSPSGFSDLERAGDPWAGRVLATIEAMKVGTAYAKPITGTVRFRLTLCKDGRVSRVSYKGGTADADARDRVVAELERLKFPPLPAAVAKGMSEPCATVDHTFSWSSVATQ